jgi:hypothetical protein
LKFNLFTHLSKRVIKVIGCLVKILAFVSGVGFNPEDNAKYNPQGKFTGRQSTIALMVVAVCCRGTALRATSWESFDQALARKLVLKVILVN